MITIKVTEIPFLDKQMGSLAETGTVRIKTFTSDKEAEKYLFQIHDEKMNRACVKAEIGHYTPGKLTRPGYVGQRDATAAYAKVEKEIDCVLQIEISHD